MHYFGRFYLDQEKDILVNLYQDHDTLYYIYAHRTITPAISSAIWPSCAAWS